MSTRQLLAKLEIQREEMAALARAYRLVRKHLQVTPAQNMVAAEIEVTEALIDLDRRVVAAREVKRGP